MSKIEYAWVIQREDGMYCVNTFAWTKKLCRACIFETLKDCNYAIELINYNCKPVKIELRFAESSMLGNKEKDKIVKQYGNYYWEQIKKLSDFYYNCIEEHKKVIEKQQKRIAELEQDLEFTTKTANELIAIKHKLEQELAIKDKMINLIWLDLFHLNNDNNDWTKSIAQYQKEVIEKLKEGDTNE